MHWIRSIHITVTGMWVGRGAREPWFRLRHFPYGTLTLWRHVLLCCTRNNEAINVITLKHPWLTPRVGLPCLTFAGLHGCLVSAFLNPELTWTSTFMTLAASGIEHGPPAWESSTLPSEPLDVRKNTSIFLTYVVNIRVHCMLHFHLSSFIIQI